MRICLHHPLQPYPGTTIARVGLPSCVTPLLIYSHTGSTDPSNRQKPTQLGSLSISAFDMGELKRVLEYQPVVHRLRLTASP
jgi:hypothetical protein